MKWAYRITLICGALPLVMGISIFLLWLLTRWDFLMSAGLLTILVGMCLSFFGVLTLAYFIWSGYRTPDYSRRRLLGLTTVGACLLLINFPVAEGIVVAAIKVDTSYLVVIRNDTDRPLENVHVSGGGCDEAIHLIPPGKSAEVSLKFKKDGILLLKADNGSRRISGTIDGYVTRNKWADIQVIINPDGSMTVSDID